MTRQHSTDGINSQRGRQPIFEQQDLFGALSLMQRMLGFKRNFMLKHFHLGRRANFPAIFLFAVVALYGAGYAFWGSKDGQEFLQPKNAFELLIAVVGISGAFVHFLYGQHHQDTQMFVNLFAKFNKRYDKLNEKLNAIVSRPVDSPLLPEHINTLYDYFNLCAEEHLFYEAGYIDEMVWQAWLRGMKHFAKDAAVLRLWAQEIVSGSYYHFNLSLLDSTELPKGNWLAHRLRQLVRVHQPSSIPLSRHIKAPSQHTNIRGLQ